MKRYYITHTDKHGERHQLKGWWEAETPEEAINQMLSECNFDAEGIWLAHIVKDDADIID